MVDLPAAACAGRSAAAAGGVCRPSGFRAVAAVEKVVVVACVSLVLAEQFRGSLAYAFGRYWPETWINGNPSLIGDAAYGFHPFHHGVAYDSFPSGHTARTLAVATVVWIAYPRWRWVCGLASLAVAVDLLGLDYHFVGDVIAGGFVGGIIGAYTARCAGIGVEKGRRTHWFGNVVRLQSVMFHLPARPPPFFVFSPFRPFVMNK